MNIAIVGSGLTGSLAAISLANAGCRVDLYERLSDDGVEADTGGTEVEDEVDVNVDVEA